jgi:hypothetical protein
VILLQDKPESPSRILAASVVAGSQGPLNNVLADESRVLPVDVQVPNPHAYDGVRFLWRGFTAVSSMMRAKRRCSEDRYHALEKTGQTFPSTAPVSFKFRGLPGTYDLLIEGFQHSAVRQSVVVGDDDVQLNVAARATN